MGNPAVGVNGRLPSLFYLHAASPHEHVVTPHQERGGFDRKSLRLDCRVGFQHPLQRFQPVGLARRLVPAQA